MGGGLRAEIFLSLPLLRHSSFNLVSTPHFLVSSLPKPVLCPTNQHLSLSRKLRLKIVAIKNVESHEQTIKSPKCFLIKFRKILPILKSTDLLIYVFVQVM